MTQEEYEAKVQSMPQSLQKMFRESLEIALSKRIVNRFMGVVMQAYAWGQRDAQTGEGSQNAAYMRGAQDMKDAIKVLFDDMTPVDIYKYFNRNHASHWDGMFDVIHNESAAKIMNAAKECAENKKQENIEKEKTYVKNIADTIGIDRLLEIANAIKQEDELPY